MPGSEVDTGRESCGSVQGGRSGWFTERCRQTGFNSQLLVELIDIITSSPVLLLLIISFQCRPLPYGYSY